MYHIILLKIFISDPNNGTKHIPGRFSVGTKAGRWVDSTEKGSQLVGELGKRKIQKVQQRTVQSPEPLM